jgi:hypothetical protein
MVAVKVRVSLRRQVSEIVFLFSRHPVFAGKLSLVLGPMLLPLSLIRRGGPQVDSSKKSFELFFRAAPTDGLPASMSSAGID